MTSCSSAPRPIPSRASLHQLRRQDPPPRAGAGVVRDSPDRLSWQSRATPTWTPRSRSTSRSWSTVPAAAATRTAIIYGQPRRSHTRPAAGTFSSAACAYPADPRPGPSGARCSRSPGWYVRGSENNLDQAGSVGGDGLPNVQRGYRCPSFAVVNLARAARLRKRPGGVRRDRQRLRHGSTTAPGPWASIQFVAGAGGTVGAQRLQLQLERLAELDHLLHPGRPDRDLGRRLLRLPGGGKAKNG